MGSQVRVLYRAPEKSLETIMVSRLFAILKAISIKKGRKLRLSSFAYLHALGPIAQRPVAQAVDHFALDPACLRADGLEAREGLAHAAAAGGGKGDDLLARKIAALQERADDGRRNVPPDGEADKNGVVSAEIRGHSRDGGAGLQVVHLHAAAAVLVHPVEVRLRVGNGGLDLEKVCADGPGEALGGLFCRAGGGEIGD